MTPFARRDRLRSTFRLLDLRPGAADVIRHLGDRKLRGCGSEIPLPRRTKLDEGDVYDAAKALGQSPGTGAGLESPGFTQLMNMAGTLTVLNQVMTQLKLARVEGSDTQLWFTTYRDHRFYRSERLHLSRDVKTDRDFLREMSKLGISRWGILRGTLGVFGEWTRFTNAHGRGDPSALVFGVDIRTG